MTQLLLSYAGDRQRMALMRDGRLLDYREAQALSGPQTEDIYLGKVGRVMKGLSAAFVRLSEQDEGFLPFDRIIGGLQPRPGDSLLVQVRRPPQGQKGAFLTGDITLPGRLCVLLPLSGGSRVSKRVEEPEAKQRLKDMAQRLKPTGMGIILREEAQGADEAAIVAELDSLKARWADLQLASQKATAPAALSLAPGALDKLLRETRTPIDMVLTDDLERAAALGLPTRFVQDPMGLNRVPHQLAMARRRRVPLKSGATLVIDPCEAMTVIDVNTAGQHLGRDREQALLNTNLEAAGEIARLLRLRRVGGMVLIDFIDMTSDEHRKAVMDALKDAAADDPAKLTILGFTALGLLEVTRARQDEALTTQTLRPCPTCGGRGTLEDTAYDHP